MVDANIPDIALEPDKTVIKVLKKKKKKSYKKGICHKSWSLFFVDHGPFQAGNERRAGFDFAIERN
jgi:hypothetical protein